MQARITPVALCVYRFRAVRPAEGRRRPDLPWPLWLRSRALGERGSIGRWAVSVARSPLISRIMLSKVRPHSEWNQPRFVLRSFSRWRSRNPRRFSKAPWSADMGKGRNSSAAFFTGASNVSICPARNCGDCKRSLPAPMRANSNACNASMPWPAVSIGVGKPVILKRQAHSRPATWTGVPISRSTLRRRPTGGRQTYCRWAMRSPNGMGSCRGDRPSDPLRRSRFCMARIYAKTVSRGALPCERHSVAPRPTPATPAPPRSSAAPAPADGRCDPPAPASGAARARRASAGGARAPT